MTPSTSRGPCRGSILVADDDEDIRRLLTLMLTRAGFDVVAVADGSAVLDAETDGPYDLYLLDIHMPGLTGAEACRELKARHDRPVLIMSSAPAGELISAAHESGADHYLHKPVPSARLVSAVESLLHPDRAPRG